MSYLGGFLERMLSRKTEHMCLADLLTEINSGCASQIQDESGVHILPLVSFISFQKLCYFSQQNDSLDVYAHRVVNRKGPCAVQSFFSHACMFICVQLHACV